jgi:hypothetical protein
LIAVGARVSALVSIGCLTGAPRSRLRRMRVLLLAVSITVASTNLFVPSADARTLKLDRVSDLTLVGARAEIVNYRGQRAVHLQSRIGHEADDDSMLAVVPASDFKDGTIELDVSGSPIPQVQNARGFIGVAFRVQAHADSFECFYIRPTNARCDDQVRRNHCVQYICGPAYSFRRLRAESPETYEAYADMEVGAWTHLKIEVAGTKARLYVNGAKQPALIVNDLKLGDAHGAIALWSHTFTDGYFANLRVN